MKDFLDGLDDRLRLIAEQQAAEDLAAAPSTSRSRRRPAVLAGLTGVLATAGAVFAMNGVSFAEDLPILETKSVDASGIAMTAGEARKAPVDFSDAHFFPTVNGPGYVAQTPDEDVLCVAIPNTVGKYTPSCGARDSVERDGLRVEYAADARYRPRSPVAFVLPKGSETIEVSGPGARDGDVQIVSGVVSASIRAAIQIEWTENAVRRTMSFQGPFDGASTVDVTCPDGRTVSGPMDVLRPPPSAQLDRDALKRACR